MKICVVSTPVFQIPVAGYSGLEHLAWQIAAGLAAKGNEVSVVAPEGSTCPGATVIPCGKAGTWDERKAYDSYWKELVKFDCIIDHTWQKWSYRLKSEGVLKAPIMGVCHAPVDTMFRSPPPVDKPCIVCISKDQAHHWQALHGRSEARVAHNGVDPDFYKPMDVPRSNRWLFLARFSTIKGPDLAIEAAKKTGVGLDLVGDSSITNEPEFLYRIKGACDGERIKMVGPASRGSCVWWFSQAYGMMHPNARFREPFGLAPVEAMLCGCPVIAWNYGAVRETIKQGVTGWLADTPEEFAAHVKSLNAKSDGEMKQMRRDCREWAGQFNVDRMILRYQELCREAVEKGW